MTRFIFVTGGVVSSLGKGLAAASLGALLQARGFSVRLCKMDPYLNIDPGTMSPFQHGEVFVTDDGAETDLDLGHYERFTGRPASAEDNITTGRVYLNVLQRERKGDYLGATIQVVPHITDEIRRFIASKDGSADFVICEVGGTVGDIESLPFLEAIRQFVHLMGPLRALCIHATLLPYIATAGELKTKPTQHSVRELMSHGIMPRILLCRADRPIDPPDRRKIALFCNLEEADVIPALDAKTIYEVPILLHGMGLDDRVMNHFCIENAPEPALTSWNRIIDAIKNPTHTVRIAIVGKYTDLADSYKSLNEALIHGGIANRAHVELVFIESEVFEREDVATHLTPVDGILVPGGFGSRGTEGKIAAARFAREHKIPYFGICFGFQMAVIEASRHLLNISDAGSSEFEGCGTPVIGLMQEWVKGGSLEVRDAAGDMGGTMRLGAYPALLREGSLAHRIYQQNQIEERHRHRYEVDIRLKDNLEKVGFIFSGLSPDGKLPEIGEYKDHPWFIGVQFHPELKSRPFAPHPLFVGFIAAAIEQSRLA